MADGGMSYIPLIVNLQRRRGIKWSIREAAGSENIVFRIGKEMSPRSMVLQFPLENHSMLGYFVFG